MQPEHEKRALDAIEQSITNIANLRRERPAVSLAKEPNEPPAPTPLPVDDVGVMAADAVLKVYEATAQRIEEMGDEVKERIAKLDAALVEAKADLEAISAAAAAIRAKGDAVRAMIAAATETSREIRDTCAGFVAKVA